MSLGEEFCPPILASCAWVALFYIFLGWQRAVKYSILGKHRTYDRYLNNFDPPIPEKQHLVRQLQGKLTAADRIVGNYLEQAPAFLICLWMYSVFVDTWWGGVLGGVYVGLRGGYPVLLGREVHRVNKKAVYFVTLPCYAIIFYMFSCSIDAALPSFSLPLPLSLGAFISVIILVIFIVLQALASKI